MTARAANALKGFIELIEELAAATADMELADLTAEVLNQSRLVEHFQKSRDGKGQDRIENLEELVNAARQFDDVSVVEKGSDPDFNEEMSELDAFLSHAALEAGETQAGEYEESVQLMTMHSAKGLEFPLVFVGGMEEGLFPHSMSSDDPERLEEERRLCYVGMTRAMEQLYLSHAESRRMHGSDSYPMPSRFLREIPVDLVEEIRSRPDVSRPVVTPAGGFNVAEETTGFALGQRVTHPKFGQGVVLNAEGQGRSARVQVNFESTGAKWLVVAYANLQVI
jgi:DNA helicase-2/ATP-dependent DNA helicase PcrA